MHSLVKALTFCVLSLSLAGCAQNPVSGKQDFVMMSEAQEISLGAKEDANVRKRYKVYEAPALQDYVNSVGQKIARKSHRPNLRYHFTVLDTSEINAFALPGGHVYVTRGILAYLNSEAELAAVLGHEIGHVTARHGVRQASAAQVTDVGITLMSILVPQINPNLSQTFAGAILSGYGRDHELEADRLGASYLARSTYDPQAMIRVIGVLKNQELFDAQVAKQEGREPRRYHGVFATHPDNDTRLQQVVAESSQLAMQEPYEGYAAYLRQIDGLVYNGSSEQGVVRNNQFMHAGLGFALAFPHGWQARNQPDRLILTSPQADAVMQLTVDKKPRMDPYDYLRNTVSGASTRDIEALDSHRLPGAVAILPTVMVAAIYLDDRVYILQGKAKTAEVFKTYRPDMLDSIKSFHAMSQEEKQKAKPLTIRLITSRAGDTYAKLAQRSPLGNQAEGYLRLINADYPQGEPRPGQLLKVVE